MQNVELVTCKYNADVKTPPQTQAIRYAVVVAAISVVTAAAYRLHVNQTTVALMFLVMVLLTSAYWGLRYALLMAVIATAAFNFFFLPPFGTFTIADPQNWVALFAFLITAVVASNLAERARREAIRAGHRSRGYLPRMHIAEPRDEVPVGTGTLAFLFTDIAGSTRLWERLPAAMTAALRRHDAILTDAIASAEGTVVKTTGDGMMAVFATAADAVDAAIAAQRALAATDWGETGQLRVRMGINAGDAERRGDDEHPGAGQRGGRCRRVRHRPPGPDVGDRAGAGRGTAPARRPRGAPARHGVRRSA